MEKKIVKCQACEFETHLVKIDGNWHYDEKKHGNGEEAKGRCFNCQKPIEYLTAEEKAAEKAAAEKAAAEKAAGKGKK